MKIIVSHDVDHLYVIDHLKRDLIIEKLWGRSLLQFLHGSIDGSTFRNRIMLLFHNRMNRIDEVMEFDKKHSIPSVFFFGMDNILGMSYKQDQAKPMINRVIEKGFDVGVHGVEFEDYDKIKKEHDDFQKLSGLCSFGIRNHYVRFNEKTFETQNEVGYLFDTTWFNKNKIELHKPYKVGNMWEFPLHIMDGYVCKEGKLDEGLTSTKRIIDQVYEEGIPYCTILFHDYQFDDRYYPTMKSWYIKIIEYCEEKGHEFTSYREAIKEMES